MQLFFLILLTGDAMDIIKIKEGIFEGLENEKDACVVTLLGLAIKAIVKEANKDLAEYLDLIEDLQDRAGDMELKISELEARK